MDTLTVWFCYSPAEECAELPKPPDLIPPEAALGEKVGLDISPDEAGM